MPENNCWDSVILIHPLSVLIVPVFQCGEALFESSADVTEQVGETVTDWGGLCRPGVKHVLC